MNGGLPGFAMKLSSRLRKIPTIGAVTQMPASRLSTGPVKPGRQKSTEKNFYSLPAATGVGPSNALRLFTIATGRAEIKCERSLNCVDENRLLNSFPFSHMLARIVEKAEKGQTKKQRRHQSDKQ
jgi:hypothetical protein